MLKGVNLRKGATFFTIEQKEPYTDRQGNWKQAWPFHVKGNGKTFVASRTNLKPRKKVGRREGTTNAGRSQRQGGGDAAKEESERSRGGDLKRHPQSAAHEVLANYGWEMYQRK